jgi:2-oxoglutarate ferredoxin oxidoreductase subunit gamma
MHEGKNVTWFPSYGAEMRGGTASSTIIISDDMIGSPIVHKPDIAIVMNKASLDRFQHRLIRKGLLFYDCSLLKNSDLRRDIEPVPLPATEIASSLGNTKSANMVMLGAFIAKTKMINHSSIITILNNSKEFIDIPRSAINLISVIQGFNYYEN